MCLKIKAQRAKTLDLEALHHRIMHSFFILLFLHTCSTNVTVTWFSANIKALSDDTRQKLLRLSLWSKRWQCIILIIKKPVNRMWLLPKPQWLVCFMFLNLVGHSFFLQFLATTAVVFSVRNYFCKNKVITPKKKLL